LGVRDPSDSPRLPTQRGLRRSPGLTWTGARPGHAGLPPVLGALAGRSTAGVGIKLMAVSPILRAGRGSHQSGPLRTPLTASAGGLRPGSVLPERQTLPVSTMRCPLPNDGERDESDVVGQHRSTWPQGGHGRRGSAPRLSVLPATLSGPRVSGVANGLSFGRILENSALGQINVCRGAGGRADRATTLATMGLS